MCPTLKDHWNIMPEVNEDVYLGDILSNEGKNTNQIFNILGNVNFGSHFF